MKKEQPETTAKFTKDIYDRYLLDIQSFPLLSREQEIELGKKAHAGDIKARDQMVKSNLRLVIKIAKGFESMGLPFLDLVSEGNIGLVRAVERYNPNEFDNKFSSYAAWLIKAEIRKALLTKSRMIRLPSHVGDKLHKIYKAKSELEIKLEREPTAEEISQELGISLYKINALFDFNSTTSLEEIEEAGVELASENCEMAYSKINTEEAIQELHKKSNDFLQENGKF